MKSLGAMPNNSLFYCEPQKEYEPGRVEEAILKHVQAEYQEAQALCENNQRRIDTTRQMAAARFLRNPNDNSEFALMYDPILARLHKLRISLEMARLIPNEGRFDWFELKLAKADREKFEEYGIDPEDAEREVTLCVRRELQRSNFVEALKEAKKSEKRYGTAFLLPDVLTKQDMVPAEEYFANDLESEMEYNAELDEVRYVSDEVVDVDGRQMVLIPVFDRLHFEVLDPANVFFGDLECHGGVSDLESFFVYQRRTLRDLHSRGMVKKNRKRIAGSYVNLSSLDPSKKTDLPGVHEGSREDSYEYDRTDRHKTAGNKTLEVPVRIGRIFFEDIREFKDDPPTSAELRQFRDKFGLSVEDLREERSFLIEWSEQDKVLIRFEPWVLPPTNARNGVLIESRYHTIDGETIGYGDYAMAGGDAEIRYNNYGQDLAETSRQLSRPMKAVIQSYISEKQRQAMGEQYAYAPNFIWLLNPSAQGTPFFDLMPSEKSAEAALSGLSKEEAQLQRITGVTPEMLGGSSGGTATANQNQKQYLEESMGGNLKDDERDLVHPMLRQALALILYVVEQQGELAFTATKEQLSIFGDKYQDMQLAEFVLTPEQVSGDYDVIVLSTGAQADRESKLTRLERLAGMMNANQNYILQQGVQFSWVEFIRIYMELEGLPVQKLLPPISPEGAQQVMALGQEAGGNPGGAGGSRPDYERTVPEVSAPGEPTMDQARDPAAMAGMAEALGI